MRVRIKPDVVLYGKDRNYIGQVLTVISQRGKFLQARTEDGYTMFLEEREVDVVEEENSLAKDWYKGFESERGTNDER